MWGRRATEDYGRDRSVTGRWLAQHGDPRRDEDAATQEAPPEVKKPPLYKVVMLNDDYTPMEFVVHVLEAFFGMDRNKATQIMLQVHTRGRAVCGVFTADIAETKSSQANEYARKHNHPLLCAVEKA